MSRHVLKANFDPSMRSQCLETMTQVGSLPDVTLGLNITVKGGVDIGRRKGG